MPSRISDTGFIARMLTAGGDRRIWVPKGADINVYGASPYPRDMLGYSASTANDISAEAFAHLHDVVGQWPAGRALSGAAYADRLNQLRGRIRVAYGLSPDVSIIFAPSGTDLEYVALHLARSKSGLPVTNIVLGADEVGSGCLLSAEGRYFATETALIDQLEKGSRLSGFEDTQVFDLPVRDAEGMPISSEDVAEAIGAASRSVRQGLRHPLAHIVHGSKTALVLPDLDGIDALRTSFGADLSLVVDACQARISSASIQAYLDRDAIVLMTGSKFMGGPPFSGFALVPPAMASAKPLAEGLSNIFRRGEWPLEWEGCASLSRDANPGLLLRLEAALFELDRYARVSIDDRDRIISAFSTAVNGAAERLGVRLIPSNAHGPDQRLERDTLATIDMSVLPCQPDFAMAQRWQRVLAARGIRVGQPVKCVKLPDGRLGGTLRLSLSMPMIVSLSALGQEALIAKLDQDMGRIISVLDPASRLAA